MNAKTVNVLYKYADGAHFFVSDDEETLGLCVAHKQPAKAFAAVSITLTKLFKENYGQEVTFTPSLSLPAFMEWFMAQTEAATSKPSPGAAGILKWNPSQNGIAA
ncbi:hypothetical protein [Rhodovulum steppense]|uniref:Uncharacterized protein n=1 Tax=Rhodovulum steppense TaxID=540251 RepID=A0A4V2R470_9RHOB|nr:hypothetical protein [Rhodovulum steppense]TCM80962.1 hypothetical protein EV216_1194 [Rhodovulum steppense]